MEPKVLGVRTQCVKGIACYSVPAENIELYFWGYQVNFSFFSPIFLFFGRHDVNRRSFSSMLCSIDIITQVY